MGTLWRLEGDAWQARYQHAAERLHDVSWLLRLRDTLRATETGGQRVVFAEEGAALAGAGRVGVFSGSFNPVTWAHVAIGAAARQNLQLDAFVWACSRVTVDKEAVERATLLDRVAQMALVSTAEGYGDRVAVVDAGLYVDQALAMRSAMDSGATLLLVVGYDKIVQILDPHYYQSRDASLQELFALTQLCVAPRGAADEAALVQLLAQPDNRRYAGAVQFLPVAPGVGGLSSTEVREHARECTEHDGIRLASMSPPEGAALACATGAYRDPANEDGDVYAWRERWLSALTQAGRRRGERPDLRGLIAATTATSERGEQARRWLRGERWPGGPATVEDVADGLLR